MKLTQVQKQKIQVIGRKYDLQLILLYGSYAKDTPHKGSDFDIALLGKKPIEFKKLLNISSALEKVFGNSADRELDVSSLHRDDPLFRFEVTKSSQLLYGNESEYTEFKAYAYQSYFDAQDLFRLESALVNKYQDNLMNIMIPKRK